MRAVNPSFAIKYLNQSVVPGAPSSGVQSLRAADGRAVHGRGGELRWHPTIGRLDMKMAGHPFAAIIAFAFAAMPAFAQQKPNIVLIMGDDIGWFNVGAYHRGMMAGRTPNLDTLAAQGMMFTDYYAEASCTAGRANFITGELPFRTGLTTVGQAGSPLGMPDEAPTIATVLKSMGYATGQFGKNHLGDRNQFLPTVHGFDEFYGYLYHLDAMEDPCHRNYPPALKATVGPRNMLHTWATDVDDPTVQPRWGKVGKQKIEDAGDLCPKRMETVDDEILANALKFLDKARQDGKPSSFGSIQPGCMSSRTFRRSTRACARQRTAGASRKPEWH